jgi:integrase
MVEIKIRHLVIKPSGCYFQPSKAMRLGGYRAEPLGKDTPAAIARVEAINTDWDATRKGEVVTPTLPASGTMDRLIYDTKMSAEFRDKSLSRQAEIEYTSAIIAKVFGPSRLSAIKPDAIERFYSALRRKGSIHKSAKVMKDLRYLFNRALRLDLVTRNPALAIRVKQPKARQVVWKAEQVKHAIQKAWDDGFTGAAVALAIAYDTSLRPGDIRALTYEQVQDDRITLTQSKTGSVQHCPLYPETKALIDRYKASLGVSMLPGAALVRTRRGRPYKKDRLARDVRIILRAAGVPDAIQLRDLRRTASKERAEAGATEAELASSTGHSIEHGSRILDTYNPRSFEQAKSAQDKRRQKALKNGT